MQALGGTWIARWGRAVWPIAVLAIAGAIAARPAHPRNRIEPLAVTGGTPFQDSGREAWEDRNHMIHVTVPAGKILIVEQVSLDASLPQGANAVAHVSGEYNGQPARPALILNPQGELFGAKIVAASQEMRLYTNNGFRFELSRSPNGRAFVNWSVTGLLVDP